MDFLKSLLGNNSQNPNEEIDRLNQLIQQNKNDIQAPWEMKANEANLRNRLAQAQPYPLAPADLGKDQFDALAGILPDKNTTFKGDVQYANSPMDPNPEMPNILASMISPQGVQRPMYNYNQSPIANANLGATFSDPNLIQQVNQPANRMLASESNPTIQKTNPKVENNSAEAKIKQFKEQASQQPKQEEEVKDSILDELLKAQEDKKSNNTLLALLEGADRIGTAMAGQGNIAYEKGKFDSLKPLASQAVDDLLQRQKFKGDQQEQELRGYNIAKAKQQMLDDKAKSDPNSDVSKMTRSSVIDSLTRIGRTDLASQISPGMSSKQVEDIFGQYNLQNMVTAHEAQMNRLEMAKITAANKAEANKAKLEQKDTDRLDKANKMITASIASSRGAFGKTANILRSAEAIETLVGQQPLGQMDSRQIQELARSLDAMLSQGAATITGTAHLVPRSMSGDAAKIKEYISNIPRGAGQAEFVKRMVETVQREKELAKKQIQRESRKMLSSYSDLAKKQPEAWKLMLQQHDLPEDIFNPDMKDEESSHPEFNVDTNAIQDEMKRRGL